MKEKIDLSFRIKGGLIPADHGYLLYSALTKLIEQIHANQNVGIHPINGEPTDGRLLLLTDRSRLTFRLLADHLKMLLPLTGKTINLAGNEMIVGTPQSFLLKPAPRLYSRLVVIKGYMEPEEFLEAAQRQLDELNIIGRPYLIPQPDAESNTSGKGTRSPYLRRTLRVSDKEVVGFALGIEELTAEESIKLQENGLGGRRRFGCGIFIPDRR